MEKYRTRSRDYSERNLELEKKRGRDILIVGSANIVQQFTNLGLIDEYQLLVHPAILGSGKPLFKNSKDR